MPFGARFRPFLLAVTLLFGMGGVVVPQAGYAQVLRDGSFDEWMLLSNYQLLQWQSVVGYPDLQVLDGDGIGIAGINTPPAAGHHYIGMHADAFAYESISQRLDIESGTHYYGRVALFRSNAHASWNGRPELRIYGTQNPASPSRDLLWSSFPVENWNEWSTNVIGFTPTKNYAYIVLEVALSDASGEAAYLCIDDLRLSIEFFGMEFLGLGAQPQPDGTLLVQWETVPLTADMAFTLESSTNGQTFSSMATTNGQIGEEAFQLSLATNTEPTYLRIKATDAGGRHSFSEVIFLPAKDMGLSVYPNPTSSHLMFALPSNAGVIEEITIMDITGKVALKVDGSHLSTQTLLLPESLPAGPYVLLLRADKVAYIQEFLLRR